MWTDLVTLFTEMHVIPAVCLILGIILCIIEIFTPGLGIFGLLGAILVVIGIIFRMVFGGSLSQLFIMVFAISFVIIIAFMIMIRSARYGWLSRSPIILNATALSREQLAKEDKENARLLGKEGIVKAECRPAGKIEIEEEIYDVVSEGEFITNGTVVRVVAIEGNKITVKRVL